MREAAATPLSQWIAAWLTHQRTLGRGYDGEQWVLAHLQRFVASTNAADLDQAGFDRWCASFANLSSTTRRGRQLAVRKFCLFRQRTEPDCFVPDPLYFARLLPYRRPVIIEPSQVEQMLTVADSLAPTANSPLLPAALHLAVVILYTAGLRRGELARLILEDIEPQTGVLRIRRRSSTNPDWRRYRQPPTTHCAPTCANASRRHSTPIRGARCCAGGATVVTGIRVLAWVRLSTACWSPPMCWTPKAVDHVSMI